MLLDTQCWKSRPGDEPTHAHNGIDLPFGPGRFISGVVNAAVRVQNVGTGDPSGPLKCLHFGLIEARFGGLNDPLTPNFLFTGHEVPGHDHERVEFPVQFDTTKVQDGWYTFVLQTRLLEANSGMRIQSRLKAPIEVRNGSKPAAAQDKGGKYVGSGWLVDPGGKFDDEKGGNLHGYCSVGLQGDSLPAGPVPQLWKPRIQFTNSRGRKTNGFVSIDPDFHHSNPGTVVFHETDVESVPKSFTIDTGKLSPGVHRMFIKCDDTGQFDDFTLEGVLVVPFEVAG
jgi:hypothetical protein